MRTTLPHQQKAVDELSNGKILQGGVGSGKTWTSLVYYYTKVCKGVVGDVASMRDPKDLIVITTAKKRDSRDWQNEAYELTITADPEASAGRVTITVDSWNNIHKYTHRKGAFFIFDEQKLVGTGAWAKSFQQIAKHNEWIILTATPGDTWLDLAQVFIANGYYRGITDFKRQHVVYNTFTKFPKVDRYVGTGRLVKLKHHVIVKMHMPRHTKRHVVPTMCDYDQELFDRVVKDRWHVYENRPIREVSELISVMRRVVNSDADRLVWLRRVLENTPKVIVFYNFDYELEILRKFLGSETTTPNTGTNPSDVFSQPESTTAGFTQKSSTPKNSSNHLNPPQSTTSSAKNGTPQSQGQVKPSSGILKTTELVRTTHTGGTTGGGQTPSATNGIEGATHNVTFAEWNGHRHQEIPETDRWVYLVQYTAGAEAWNCIETDTIFLYSLNYSYKVLEQVMGRIDRMNTPFVDLFYHLLITSSPIDQAILAALRAKETFNEKKFGERYVADVA